MEMDPVDTRATSFCINCLMRLDWLALTSVAVEIDMRASTLRWGRIRAKMLMSLLSI